MVKKFMLLILISTLISLITEAQENSAYEIQRTKINALLAERSAKFGQYDNSLNERTGIFGFQTKRDIRNSNEILRQIAINDNNIFQELKVLLDYKDLQVEQAKSASNSNSENIINYRTNIKKLQDQNLKLQEELDKSDGHINLIYVIVLLLFIACGYLIYQLNARHKKLKSYEKASI